MLSWLLGGICTSCFVEAVLAIGMSLGAVAALRSLNPQEWAGSGWLEPLRAKLGSCWRCMLTSGALLAVSLAALGMALRSSAGLPTIVVLSVATGLLLGLVAAHGFLFAWKKAEVKAARLQGEPVAEVPHRKCCGG